MHEAHMCPRAGGRSTPGAVGASGPRPAPPQALDFFKGVLNDEDFRRRTTYLAMRVLYDRYRGGEAEAGA